MALIPLQLPPGIHRNGTDFESSNRWRDASLVRWHDGSLRPVGGWQSRKTSAFPDAPRGMISFLDNSSDSYLVGGTYNSLKYINPSHTVYDITPSGLTSGNLNGSLNLGYGGGFYGHDEYSSETTSSVIYAEVPIWQLATSVVYLLACQSTDVSTLTW